jgi:uncharacterized protein (TIGR03067 family)
MRHAIGLTFLATLALPAWADDKPGGDDKLVGKWVIVKEETSRGTRTAAEGHEILSLAGDGKGVLQKVGIDDIKVTWRADPGRSPHTLDLFGIFPKDDKPRTLKAIYRLDGEDLEIAFTRDDRPKAFDPKEATIITFKRQKP